MSTAGDAQILGYLGLVCLHKRSTPCDECAEKMPAQLRRDLKHEFERIKQAVAENPYWPEIPPAGAVVGR